MNPHQKNNSDTYNYHQNSSKQFYLLKASPMFSALKSNSKAWPRIGSTGNLGPGGMDLKACNSTNWWRKNRKRTANSTFPTLRYSVSKKKMDAILC